MKRRNLYLILILIVVLGGAGVFFSLYVQAGRQITSFVQNRPLPGAVLYDEEGEMIKRLGKGSVYVPLDQTPQDLQNAIKATQGAKTINRRLARQILEPQGMWARLQLAILPSVLQRRYSERERLEMYLNQAYFGEGAYGVEAASQKYFAKPVRDIDLAQSALLAALAQEPEQASPFNNPGKAKESRDAVLLKMQDKDLIDKTKHEQARQTAVDVERREPGYAHHFSDYLGNILVDKLGEERVFQGGLRVTTTLNRDLQRLAESIFQDRDLDGALVALNPDDGKILVMVGGRDYLKDTTNLATTKQKEVASTLRPLIYALGLKEEWAMNHLVEDIQRKFGDFAVKNADDRYWGPVTMKHALVMDLHNATVWTLNELGPEKFATFAQSVHLKLNAADQNLHLAMGQLDEGLSLLQLTAAYLPAANEGVYAPVSGFEQVTDTQKRNVLTDQTTAPQRVLSKEQAYLLTNMLMPGTEYGSIRHLEVDFPAALSASTSQDGSAEWAVGYTPTLLVGVYLSAPKATQEEEQRSQVLAGEIWVEFMKGAIERTNNQGDKGEKASKFMVPENVETDVLIDVFTGLLGSERCAQVELDAFIKGTKPTQMAPCALPPPKPTPPVVPTPPTKIPSQPVLPAPEPEPEPEPEPAPPIQPEPAPPAEETTPPQGPTPAPTPSPEPPSTPPVQPEPPNQPIQPDETTE